MACQLTRPSRRCSIRPPTGATRLARLVGRGHPVRTFLAGVAVSYCVIAGLSIVLGLLVTHLVHADAGLADADGSFVRFLARHRSDGLTDASLIGSIMAGGVVLPIVVGVCGAVAAAFRQWRLGAFLIFALGIESAAYRTTTLVVHRQRPSVHRLEHLPVNASYPSGHTAASIAVYCGLALLLTLAYHEPLRAGPDLGGRGGDSRLRRSRTHVPGDAPSARRPGRRLHRRRGTGGNGARSPAQQETPPEQTDGNRDGTGRSDGQGRGRRPRRQDVRRRPAGAAARAREAGRGRPALVRGAEEPHAPDAGRARARTTARS